MNSSLLLNDTGDVAPERTSGPRLAVPAATGRLIVADLSGMAFNRRMVGVFATGVAKLAQRRPGGGPVSLLVYAPYGDGATIAELDGVSRYDASAFIDATLLARANEWTYAKSLELAHGVGRELFPTIDGIHFGALNLLWVQGFLKDYAMLAAAVRAFGSTTPVKQCTVVSGNADVARRLASDARSFARTVRAWHPPERLHAGASRVARVVRREQPRPPQPPVPANAGGALVVSDSPPMRAMFDVVETHLSALGAPPVTRLNYVQRANEAAVMSGAIVARVAPLASACPPDARATILRHRRNAQHLGSGGGWEASNQLRAFLADVPVTQFLRQLSVGSFEEQAAQLAETRALIETNRPRAVVVGNDRWWFGQGFVRIARELGIPTMSLQDGLEGDMPSWFWATADVIATTGTIYPEYLTAHGIDGSRIRVVGQPRYDKLVATARSGSSSERRVAARERLGIPRDTYCVLFAAQTDQDPSYASQVANAVLAVPHVHLVVRPHPSSRLGPYTERFENHPSGRVTLQVTGDSFDVLNAADAVVLQHSTVAVEAAILGRAVMTANFSGLPDVVPYAELGLSLRTNSPAEVTATVARLAQMSEAERTAQLDEARRALERLVGPQDGQAGLRAATVAASILSERGPIHTETRR